MYYCVPSTLTLLARNVLKENFITSTCAGVNSFRHESGVYPIKLLTGSTLAELASFSWSDSQLMGLALHVRTASVVAGVSSWMP